MSAIRIAMWSGPRNISTAMLRAWENRADTQVVDEPLYGPYLHKSQKKHPMYAQIMQQQGTDAQVIIKQLTQAPLQHNTTIFYQKHMCHHILQDMDISWVKSVKNAFLIRNPQNVLSSYLKKHSNPTVYDLGYPQQLKIFNFVKHHCGYVPCVMESKDVLENPEKMLRKLCQQLSVDFDDNMLSWPTGYRESDGIWAPCWYNRVIESSGFAPYQQKPIHLNSAELKLVEECMPYYLQLKKYKITV